MEFFIVLLVIGAVWAILQERAKEVREEAREEALADEDEEEAEEIENMTDEEVFENYEDRL